MDLLWNKENGLVSGEPGMFFGKNPVRLFFPAEKILNVRCPAREITYRAGVDYYHEPGSDLLYLTAVSSIPALPETAIHPDPQTAIVYPDDNANAISNGPDKELLIFDNCSFFARHQVEIDYQAADRAFPEFPRLAPAQFPRLREKLKQGKPLSIVLIGDSISEGFNASSYIGIPPYAPVYIEQFARMMEAQFGCRITVKNAAIEGTGCENALLISDRWLTEHHDLMVIAYGMNDFIRTPAARYKEVMKEIMAKKRASDPDTEFILIASMSGNPDWRCTPAGPDKIFADALRELAADHAAVADVHSLWQRLLQRKNFYDLTGNGVNHPNDFGHRVYASVLMGLFEGLDL